MTRSEMFDVVKANIEKVVEEAAGREITEHASMVDLGADSLQIVEVVSRSIKELRLKVPRTELASARTVKDLLDLFERSAQQPTAH
ncbi:MAG: phosphopantetheine-binding protein [Vicinamibacterales bacterium]